MIYGTPPIEAAESAAIKRIDAIKSQLRFHLAEPKRWHGPLRRILSARAIQGSNTIEGYNVSVEDAVAAVEGGEATGSPSDDNWQAIVGYRTALTYVLQLAHDNQFEYSAQLIRSLHYMMTQHFMDASPGLWRPGSIWVHSESTGEIVYEAPDHTSVPGLVGELVESLAADSGTPAMIRAAMAHLNLVMIHPFRDGNGRMSRCLQTLVLAREGVLTPELCSIEEYLGRNTTVYYDVLGRTGRDGWNPSGDAGPWVRFCLTAHFIQGMSVLRRIKESQVIWERCGELAQTSRLQPRVIGLLYDATLGLIIRNAAYRTGVKRAWDEDISSKVASDDLNAMVRVGLLRLHGARRGAHYTAGEALRRLRSEVRKDRVRLDASGLFSPEDSDAIEPRLPY